MVRLVLKQDVSYVPYVRSLTRVKPGLQGEGKKGIRRLPANWWRGPSRQEPRAKCQGGIILLARVVIIIILLIRANR